MPATTPAATSALCKRRSRCGAGLGIIDVSTLAKLQVCGPDAAELLERLYTGRFKKQVVGRCRYGVALDESGVVIEDGVIARLGEGPFLRDYD